MAHARIHNLQKEQNKYTEAIIRKGLSIQHLLNKHNSPVVYRAGTLRGIGNRVGVKQPQKAFPIE